MFRAVRRVVNGWVTGLTTVLGGPIAAGLLAVSPAGPAAAQGDLGPWSPLGPGQLGGRTRALAIKPDEPNVLLAGGVGGGIWRSEDSGVTWEPRADNAFSLAITSIAFDPNDPNIVYASTGEGFGDVDSIRGRGIYRSNNAGLNWQVLPATVRVEDLDNFYWVNDLEVRDEGGTTVVYAAARSGLWRSEDGGADWTIELANPGEYNPAVEGPAPALAGLTTLGFTDVESGGDYVLAASGSFVSDGVYRRGDADLAWSLVGTPADLNVTQQGRKVIAISPSNPSFAYVLVARDFAATPGGNTLGQFVNLYQSTDSGLTWFPRVDLTQSFYSVLLSNPLTTIPGCLQDPAGFNAFDDARAAYSMALAVDPLDENTVWLGGVDLFRSNDGGRNWGVASYSYFDEDTPNYVHSEHHLLVFSPTFNGTTDQTLYSASDGGIAVTSQARAGVSQNICPPAGVSLDLPDVLWQQRNAGYNVSRLLDGDAAPSGRVVAASIDDGALVTDVIGPTADWQDFEPLSTIDGVLEDATQVVIDPDNPLVLYATYSEKQLIDAVTPQEYLGLFPDVRRSTNGGGIVEQAISGLTGSVGAYEAPLVRDPSNASILWTASDRVFRSTNGGAQWSPASPLSQFSALGVVTALAVAPTDSNTVYLGFSEGSIAVSQDALSPNPTWIIRGPDGITPGATVSAIAVDPFDPQTAYLGSSSRGVAQLCRTSNLGSDIEVIDQFLTFAGTNDVPVHSIAVRPTDPDQIFIGTENGLFVTENGGEFFLFDNNGLPNTVVEDLVFQNDNRLLAFTRGRGAFASDLVPTEIVRITTVDGAPLPDVLPVNESLEFEVVIETIEDTLASDPRLEVRANYFGAPTVMVDLVPIGPASGGGTLYTATIPAAFCGEDPFYRVVAEGVGAGESSLPAVGEVATEVIDETILLVNSGTPDEDFVASGTASDGLWEPGVPEGNNRADPATDADGNNLAWLTDVDPNNENSDVDAGTAVLTTAPFALPEGTFLRYQYWFNDATSAPAEPIDTFTVELLIPDQDPIVLTSLAGSGGPAGTAAQWRSASFSTAQDIPTAESAQLRISITDIGNPNIIEGGFDALDVRQQICEVCLVDLNFDGVITGTDFIAFILEFNASRPAADINGDGSVSGVDFTAFIANFQAGCPDL